jgi:hypothetical protein
MQTVSDVAVAGVAVCGRAVVEQLVTGRQTRFVNEVGAISCHWLAVHCATGAQVRSEVRVGRALS